MVYLYKKKHPLLNDIVNVRIGELNDYSYECFLTEYNDIKACILLSELSKKKYNTKLIQDQIYQLLVFSIDNEYIYLSKNNITENEILTFIENYKIHLRLYNFFKNIYFRYYNMINFKFIEEARIEKFMDLTLWKIQEIYPNDKLLEYLFDKNKYDEILKNITINIKPIVYEYINIKTSKQFINKNIKILTYKINGVDDIKYILDFKIYKNYYDFYNFLIKITYVSNSIYNIYIEKIYNINNETCEQIYEKIIKEILERSMEKDTEIIFL